MEMGRRKPLDVRFVGIIKRIIKHSDYLCVFAKCSLLLG